MADEENKYAPYGNSLEPFDEDDVPKKKPIRPEDQIVTDEKGRRRFHGAFTGGFSAGYFNSVGSEEGWTPSSFLSSRSNRNVQTDKCPEDYMDSEDTGVFGIAPRTIHTTKMFTAPEHDVNKRKRTRAQREQSAFLFDENKLKDLVVPLNNSIGVKLLYKMGWKHGQGIGPKVKRKSRKPVEKDAESSVKVYGCSLPSTHDNESDEEFANFTFAPKDIEIVQYVPKENQQGLGYQGLDKRPILSSAMSLFGNNIPPSLVTKKPVGMQGQAFGVGAFEDDDEDIYTVEDMSNYNFEETAALKEAKKKSDKVAKAAKQLCKILEGFQLATKPSPAKKYFPLPNLPKNFKPFHKSHPIISELPTEPEVSFKKSDQSKMGAAERGVILTQEIPKGSVFNFIAPHDKARLDAITAAIRDKSTEKESESLEKLIDETAIEKEENAKQKTDETVKPMTFKPSKFKPFASDCEKQQRYEEFLATGATDPKAAVQPKTMTEWEKVREKEEFQKASQLYRPLAAGIASRFVSSTSLEQDDTTTELPPKPVDAYKNDLEKAVEMKMFGRLTRETVAWYPDKLVCRRFNVPNPYPDSNMVGVEKVKKEKFSIFNFLTAGTLENATAAAARYQDEKETTDNEDAGISNEYSNNQVLDIKIVKKDEKIELEVEKPPMDLFKAIFQDSSESSSEEEEEKEEEPQETNSNEDHITEQVVVKTPELQEIQTKVGKESRWGPAVPEIINPELITTHIDEPLPEDVCYGPKLPPTTTVPGQVHEERKKPTTTVPGQVHDERKKHKDRKHKKHKKHKKRRKHASSSSSESELNSEEDVNPKELLKRLKAVRKKTKTRHRT